MTRHAVEIAPGVPAYNSRISIDGHDISAATQRLTVDLDARSGLPEVRLELQHVDITPFAAAEAEIVLTAPTREALIALGWTPPPEEA